jgi:hypothetical protein
MSDDLEAQSQTESADQLAKPWYRRWWAITAGGLLALFVLAGIFGDDTGSTTTAEPTAAATSGPSEPEPTEQITPPLQTPTTTAALPPAPATAVAPPPPVEPPPVAPPVPEPVAPVPPPAEPADECHPSYDPCVPIASDVDCEGGSGNGPVYTGTVRVIGSDEYDLDRDGDGVGCEQS